MLMTLICENRMFYGNFMASGFKNINHKFVSLHVNSPVEEEDKAFSWWLIYFCSTRFLLPYFKTAVLKVGERGETFDSVVFHRGGKMNWKTRVTHVSY